jgi:hypothetical protein
MSPSWIHGQRLGLTARRLMSDYEVTLVNDNSKSRTFHLCTSMLEGGVKRMTNSSLQCTRYMWSQYFAIDEHILIYL